ncbi:HAMP domain-containing sensor histidine kinase [Halospina sp. K52047b]|uniref:sensor histidine kinase n=1 Tax=Halospina sp. K52047b TaxID=2614160 RepID=UPI001249F214|nr:HAMP domain-containing sensor histidine kinase [Halospina sp. K52047b]KAA8980350.1 HAMP domain-containing histidine kinase [Halospina sp. K52047b]
MKPSLSRRLFFYLFGVSLVTTLLSGLFIELFYNNMENAILSNELAKEQAFFLDQIEGATPQSWSTARLRAFYLPDGHSDKALPEYLRDKPAPYSGEIGLTHATYLVRVQSVEDPPGRLFLSQDISIMESHERLTQLVLIGILLVMVAVGFLLSRLSARHLVNPLRNLTAEIQATEPAKAMRRLNTHYSDREFADIANAFNRFLDAIEHYVEREKSFVKLASHEFRTPLAVMTGALDILEQRKTLSDADRRTLARIRGATDDMHSDVDILLKLSRGHVDADEPCRLNLQHSIEEALEELESSQNDYHARLRFVPDDRAQTVTADPSLVRMLLRNLLLNALKHTRDVVEVKPFAGGVSIRDYGEGLPERVATQLSQRATPSSGSFQETSFGLLIVQLICERLGWIPNVVQSGQSGTEIEVWFDGH